MCNQGFTADAAVEMLLDRHSHEKVMVDVWTETDFHYVAEEELGVELTGSEVEEAMSIVKREHDATIGINWDVMSHAVQQVIKTRG